MALKFLNKKGWHTGSLRNIENVWKAEQKHEAEQKKLEELRKQIHEERERAEFRQLQEQAGLIPKQERLDFLYDSGLAVGKRDSGFKALESFPKAEPEAAASSSSAANQQSAVPGALFEEKPQSANDSWRKLHSDPLLMIRQREQEALARIKNNPVRMAMIRKSVETQKDKGKDEKKHRKKSHKKKSKHRKHSSSENESDSEDVSVALEKQREGHHKHSRKAVHTSDEDSDEVDARKKSYQDKDREFHRHSSPPNSKYDKTDDHEKSKRVDYDTRHTEYSSDRHLRIEDSNAADDYHKRSYYERKNDGHRRSSASNSKYVRSDDREKSRNGDYDSRHREYSSDQHVGSRHDRRSNFNPPDKPPKPESTNHSDRPHRPESNNPSDRPPRPESKNPSDKPPRPESNNRRRNTVKLSEEERAARLREMQMDAELHEAQRWKRLKKAADNDAEEAIKDKTSAGRNFLDAAQKSVYGAEKGGSTTIEESVRRRTHYSQGRLASETNAFRRS